MSLDKGQLTTLFKEIDFVLKRLGRKDLSTNNPFILEHSQEGGIVRVEIINALFSTVTGADTVTKDEDRSSQPWYSDTDEFIKIATMAIGRLTHG